MSKAGHRILLLTLAMMTGNGLWGQGFAMADPATGCAALRDPIAARICRIDDEIARVEPRFDSRPLRCSVRGTAIDTRTCGVMSEMADAEAAARLSTANGTIAATSGAGVAGPTFAGAALNPEQRMAVLSSRRQLLEVAQARVELGEGQGDNMLIFLAPLLLLLLVLAGGGDGDPISPS